MESIASVGDYLVALETYRAAVKRWPKDKITLRNRRGCSRRVGGINGRCSAHCAPPAGGVPQVRAIGICRSSRSSA